MVESIRSAAGMIKKARLYDCGKRTGKNSDGRLNFPLLKAGASSIISKVPAETENEVVGVNGDRGSALVDVDIRVSHCVFILGE